MITQISQKTRRQRCPLHWLQINFRFFLFLIFCASSFSNAQQSPDPILEGVIDTHIHTEEEYGFLESGSVDMMDLAKRARDKGMRAVVVKSLKFETATRAYLVQKQVPGIEVYGGITLDLSVGGNESGGG